MSIMGISPTGDDDWWHWWHCVIGKYNTRWTYGGSTQPLAIAWITQENKKLIKSTNLNAFLWRHVHWETKPSRIHIAHFALHLHFALHTENCTLYAPLSTLWHSTLHFELHTLHFTLHSLHCTPEYCSQRSQQHRKKTHLLIWLISLFFVVKIANDRQSCNYN